MSVSFAYNSNSSSYWLIHCFPTFYAYFIYEDEPSEGMQKSLFASTDIYFASLGLSTRNYYTKVSVG